MKKLYVVNLCVLLIMFLTAGIVGRPNTDSSQIKLLVTDRITALNDYYSQDTTYDETEDILRQLEKEKLLRSDLALMKAYSATDMDRIQTSKVKVKSCKRTSYGIIKGNAEISYVMYRQHGKWRDKQVYFFTAEDKKGKIKLTQLKKI
ncbi:hypothetical protein ACPW7J_07785 [Ihubacter sp. rT4E-8]|uniref:hypothetical protein n=1 Tax=Ihubacter sp. rT4E-8 TaxID=3242369 RepID=UPI003CF298F0